MNETARQRKGDAREGEEALVDLGRFRSGDKDEFERIFHWLWPETYRMAYRLLLDHDEAEEAAQTAFVRAYAGRASLTGGDALSLRSWIRRTAWRAGLDLLERKGRLDEETEEIEDDRSWADPSAHAIAAETMRDVRTCLQRLSPQDRTVLLLSEMDRLPQGEIARILDTTVGAVKVRLHRARKRFRESYTGGGEIHV